MQRDDFVRLKRANEWFNGGQCCGHIDADGTCAAPACIRGEAVGELVAAGEALEASRSANDRAWAIITKLRKELGDA